VDARFRIAVGDDGTVTLHASGEIDFQSADFLATVLLAALMEHRPQRAVVDLGDVQFIDSQGLAALVSCHRDATDAGIELTVANVRPLAARPLRITGVGTLFAVTPQAGAGAE
jgi:anti-sigma B factor antagonist